MIKMERGQFYLLIWMLVTGTGSFFGVDMQVLSTFSMALGIGLFAHHKHMDKQDAQRSREEYELKKKVEKLSLLFALMLLTACTTTNIQTYGVVDPSDKTITVPAGSKGLKGEIKQALTDAGWTLAVYGRGPSVIEDRENRLEQFDTYNTRYKLALVTRVYDYCFDFTPAVEYDISLIDNYTGTEVMTMEGTGCEDAVAQEFIKALNGGTS